MIIGISGKIASGKDTVAQMIQYLDYKERRDDLNLSFEELHNQDGVFTPEGTRSLVSVYNSSQWETRRFADKLKDTVCEWLGCTREQLENREFKEAPLGEEWNCWEVKYKYDHPAGFSEQWEGTKLFLDENKAIDWSEDNYLRGTVTKRQLTPRLLMQLLGTEAGREIIHPNIWVNALFADYKGRQDHFVVHEYREFDFPKWIIPDTRFPNEAKAIKDRGGILIRINRVLLPPKKYEDGHVVQVARNPLDEHPSETALDKWEDWDYVIDNNASLEDLLDKVTKIYNQIIKQ